jgi:uncharacterized protein (TIGR02996 family)
MSDNAGLLRAILDDPDDDTPRLVFADWLEEHDEGARAELIRLQCHLARLCHSADAPFESALEAGQLLPGLRQAFLAPLVALGLAECGGRFHYGGDTGLVYYFRRGFVEDIEVFGAGAAQRFIEQAQRLFGLTPLRHLRFRPERSIPTRPLRDSNEFEPVRLPSLAALVRLPEVARLRSLDLRGHNLGDGVAWALLGSPHLGPSTVLLLGGNGISPDSEQALRERFGNAVSFHPRPNVPPFAAGEDDIPF